jgi:hypothetical protein
MTGRSGDLTLEPLDLRFGRMHFVLWKFLKTTVLGSHP